MNNLLTLDIFFKRFIKSKCKPRPFAQFALNSYFLVMLRNYVIYYCQSQACTALVLSPGLVRFVKPLPYQVQIILFYAYAIIFNTYVNPFLLI